MITLPPTSTSHFQGYLAFVSPLQPCSKIWTKSVYTVISLDATDLSGEHMREINHDVKKIRLDNQGVPFPDQENKFSGMVAKLYNAFIK